MTLVDYPIIHFADNECIGAFGGGSVIKADPEQQHGLQVHLKRFTSWGYREAGFEIEYVGQYVLSDFRCVAAPSFTGFNADGIEVQANSYVIAIVRARTEGNKNGIHFRGGNIYADNSEFDGTNHPRYIVEEHEPVGDTAGVTHEQATSGITKTFTTQQTRAEASTNLPFVIADYSGSALSNFQDGDSTDTVGGTGMEIPLPGKGSRGGLEMLGHVADFGATRTDCSNYLDNIGYYTNSGNNVLVFPFYISDRITALPVIEYHAINYTGSVTGKTNLGAWTISANAPDVSSVPTLTTTQGTAGSIDVVGNCTDSDGTGTLALLTRS